MNCCFRDKTSTIKSSEKQRMKTYLISTNHSQSVVCVTGDVENARGPAPLVPDAPGEMIDLIELLPIEHFARASCFELNVSKLGFAIFEQGMKGSILIPWMNAWIPCSNE